MEVLNLRNLSASTEYRSNIMKKRYGMIGAVLAACMVLSGCVNDKTVENLGRLVKGTLGFTGYDSVSERWKNEHVSDNRAAEQAIEALIESADRGDRDAFAKNFTDELRGTSEFDSLLDDFFAEYPKGLSEVRLNGSGVSSSGSYNYGHNVLEGSTNYKCTLNGEWYIINLGFCYENTDEPEKVGVDFFTIMNTEARAVHQDAYSRDSEHYENIHLLCDIRSSDEVNARMIGGYPKLWTDTDTEKLTADEMRELLSEYRSLGVPEVRDRIGDANAEEKFFNCTGYDYYYELAPENGEPRYAYICAAAPYGRIIDAYLSTPDETIYDDPLCPYIKPDYSGEN